MPSRTLDEVIDAMMNHEGTRLSAEACNAVNFAKSTHPCCKGKSEIDRVHEVIMATAGRDIHPRFKEQLERLRLQVNPKGSRP